MEEKLTEKEIIRERVYRYDEMLNICCEEDDPTQAQMETATKVADAWEKAYRKQVLEEENNARNPSEISEGIPNSEDSQ